MTNTVDQSAAAAWEAGRRKVGDLQRGLHATVIYLSLRYFADPSTETPIKGRRARRQFRKIRRKLRGMDLVEAAIYMSGLSK